MKKSTRLLSLALSFLFMIPAVSGCKTNTTASNASAGTSTAAKTPELVWWTIGSEPKDLSAVNAKINEYIKDKVGATVKIKYSNWGDYSQKLTTVIQSGESYDLAFGASIANYQTMVEKGYFADLSKVLPEKAPTLYNYIPKALWSGMTYKGQIFGVPAYKDTASAQYWVYDKSVVDKLGIDYQNIKTFADLEPVLKKIKANDPGKYPLPMYNDDGFTDYLNDYDILLKKPFIGVKYSDVSAKVVSVLDQPDVQSTLKTLHSWMKAGYINPDAATLKDQPKYRAVFTAQGFPGADAEWTKTYGYTTVSQIRDQPKYSTFSIQGSFIVVSASSKNVDKSVKFLELVNTDKYLRNLIAFGIEGTHYQKTGDNTIKVLNDSYTAPAYSQGTFFNLFVVEPGSADKWQKVEQQNNIASSSPILGFMFDTSKVNNQISACTTICDKYYANIMTGTVDPSVEIPKLVKELNAAGYQDIIKEAQSQVDSFMKSK